MTFHWVVSISLFVIGKTRGTELEEHETTPNDLSLGCGLENWNINHSTLLHHQMTLTCTMMQLVDIGTMSLRTRAIPTTFLCPGLDWIQQQPLFRWVHRNRIYCPSCSILSLVFIALTITSSIISDQEWTLCLCVFRSRIKIKAINIKQRAVQLVLVLVRENLSKASVQSMSEYKRLCPSVSLWPHSCFSCMERSTRWKLIEFSPPVQLNCTELNCCGHSFGDDLPIVLSPKTNRRDIVRPVIQSVHRNKVWFVFADKNTNSNIKMFEMQFMCTR